MGGMKRFLHDVADEMGVDDPNDPDVLEVAQERLDSGDLPAATLKRIPRISLPSCSSNTLYCLGLGLENGQDTVGMRTRWGDEAIDWLLEATHLAVKQQCLKISLPSCLPHTLYCLGLGLENGQDMAGMRVQWGDETIDWLLEAQESPLWQAYVESGWGPKAFVGPD